MRSRLPGARTAQSGARKPNAPSGAGATALAHAGRLPGMHTLLRLFSSTAITAPAMASAANSTPTTMPAVCAPVRFLPPAAPLVTRGGAWSATTVTGDVMLHARAREGRGARAGHPRNVLPQQRQDKLMQPRCHTTHSMRGAPVSRSEAVAEQGVGVASDGCRNGSQELIGGLSSRHHDLHLRHHRPCRQAEHADRAARQLHGS